MAAVEGKVAFITGGMGGLGLAMTKELLKNGAKGVALIDLCEDESHQVIDELESTYGNDTVIFVKTDVTNKDNVEEAFKKTVEFYNQLDIVINSAGIVDEVQWDKTVAVNLSSVIEVTYLAMEKYLPEYKSGEEGVIVNIASVLGLLSFQYAPIYSATKHAVVSLGEALGGDAYYKRYQVRVVTICPGVTDTPIINQSPRTVKLYDEHIQDPTAKFNEKIQSADFVGRTLIKVLKEGKTGSLWVIEDEEPAYEVVIPDRKSMRKDRVHL